MTRLSIITINYNDAAGLKQTIESVLQQTERDFEFLVIDGGSTDKSTEVMKQYEAGISIGISEKDKGIYDAQNKGIEKATGEYLLFLNSGDTFYSNDVVEKFYRFIAGKNEAIIYGNTNLITEAGGSILVQPDTIDPEFWYMGTLNHQAVFMKKELFVRFGLYNLNYRICSDFELFLKAYVADPSLFSHMNEVICNYDQFGFSAEKENFNLMLSERQAILQAHLSRDEYERIKKAYNNTLPLKRQLLNYIDEKPLLNSAFKRFYKVYAVLRGRK